MQQLLDILSKITKTLKKNILFKQVSGILVWHGIHHFVTIIEFHNILFANTEQPKAVKFLIIQQSQFSYFFPINIKNLYTPI